MNAHNLKRRRPYGHEDAPVAPSAQGSSPVPPISNGVSHPGYYSNDQLYILQEASSILQCPLRELIALDRVSRSQIQQQPLQQQQQHQHQQEPQQPQHPSSSTSYRVPFKRQRISTNQAVMYPGSPAPRPFNQEMSGYNYHTGEPDNGFSLAQYFTSFACPPCTTCDPPGYAGVPSSFSGHAAARPLFGDEKQPMSQLSGAVPSAAPSNSFDYSSNAGVPPSIPAYPTMQPNQPTAVQPTTRGEDMVYPGHFHDYTNQPQQPSPMNNHLMSPQSYGQAPLGMPGGPAFSSATYSQGDVTYQVGFAQAGDRVDSISQQRGLDIVLASQKPTQAKRGPFKSNNERQATAETRKIGSCIRCRMQRIRCQTNPADKFGACLTCQRVSSMKIWRLPCLRYKITDVRLFKPGQVKGYEWTRRWREGVADDIANWASAETRHVQVTEGYTSTPIRLQVRQFIPQEGDSLKRTWVYEGEKKSVEIPPYAIVNLEQAKEAYDKYISRGVYECCYSLLNHRDKFLLGTYMEAMKHAQEASTPPREKDLLKKALRLWMAIRLTTKSTVIVGEETLGMSHNIMDDTSPLRGQIPLPPVMGAQIELILIHQIQTGLRREMLENLQQMTQANKHQTWFTTYLVTFILLHNVALLCQHDAGYARKHGFKSRFAREDMVREYQIGANILLAYFHYCNKGIYPFSAECKQQDLLSLAELDEEKSNFIMTTRKAVNGHKKLWEKIRRSNDYENDFYYISQLYEQNWSPQATI